MLPGVLRDLGHRLPALRNADLIEDAYRWPGKGVRAAGVLMLLLHGSPQASNANVKAEAASRTRTTWHC
jgi:hypothetical protein